MIRPLAVFRRSQLFSKCPFTTSTGGVKQVAVSQGAVTWRALDKDAPFVDSEHADKKETPFGNLTLEKMKKLPRNVVATLMPHGYPDSVQPGYDRFVVGQVVGSVASSAGGVLSMQALLHAIGLGAGAIPMAAALQWVVKDGLGQLGGVLFAANVNTRFDSDPRRWRLVSSVALDAACFLELLSPGAPFLFIPLAATANVGKNMSWLAASASRAAIHNSFAKGSNLADITAKTGSQSIAASLAGTSLGVALASQLGPEWGAPVLLCFAGLSSIHLTSMWWSLKQVTNVNTLNSQRLAILAQAFLDDEGGKHARAANSDVAPAHAVVGTRTEAATSAPMVMGPRDCSFVESFVPTLSSTSGGFYGTGLEDLGVCFGSFPLPCAARTPQELQRLQDLVPNNAFKYALSVRTQSTGDGDGGGGGGEKQQQAVVMLVALEGADATDLAAGAVHALLLKRNLEQLGGENSTPGFKAVKVLSHAESERLGAFLLPTAHTPPVVEPGSAQTTKNQERWVLRTDLLEATSREEVARTTNAFVAALEVSEWRTDVHHLQISEVAVSTLKLD